MKKKTNQSNKTVIILTMPRNGSSLLAGILHRLGVPMGNEDDLAKGRHLNKYGCHEDQAFQSVTLNMLFEAGLLLDMTRRFEIDEENLRRIAGRYKSDVKKIIARRQSRPVWGFKDPSLIYGLPYFHDAFPDPYYIHLKRNDEESAASLFKTFRPDYWLPEMKEKFPLFKPRNRFLIPLRSIQLLFKQNREYNNPDVFKKVMQKGHRRIEKFIDNKKSLTIQLADLTAKPEKEVRRLIDFLPVTPLPHQVDHAVDFVKPDLLGQGNNKSG